MSTTTNDFNTQSSAVPAVTIKKTDEKDLITGEDFRSQAAQVNPLAGNDTPVRDENNDSAGA